MPEPRRGRSRLAIDSINLVAAFRHNVRSDLSGAEGAACVGHCLRRSAVANMRHRNKRSCARQNDGPGTQNLAVSAMLVGKVGLTSLLQGGS